MFQKYNLLNVIKRHTFNSPLKFSDVEKRFRVPASKVAQRIRVLMIKGEPICITRTGYFYASDYKQAKPTIEALKYKAAVALKAASAIEKRFEHTGQQKLF